MKHASLLLVLGLAVVLSGRSPTRAQDEKPPEDPRLVAIGGLGATAAYFAFVTVGITADAFEGDAYDAARVREITTEVRSVLKTNREQLADLRKTGLTEEDAAFVAELAAVMEMIAAYATKLDEYTANPGDERADAFQKQRTETWARLKKLLAIE